MSPQPPWWNYCAVIHCCLWGFSYSSLCPVWQNNKSIKRSWEQLQGGKWAVLRKHNSMFLESQKHRRRFGGHSVLPIHQNYKIFYFCLSFLLKEKVVSVTAQEINDILGSIPSPCRLPGIRAPLLPLPGMESCPHSPSASFGTFQSHSKAGKKPQWAQMQGTARGHPNLTCSAGTPSSARADSKKVFAGFPTTSAWISQAYWGKKKRETQKNADWERICSAP